MLVIFTVDEKTTNYQNRVKFATIKQKPIHFPEFSGLFRNKYRNNPKTIKLPTFTETPNQLNFPDYSGIILKSQLYY